MSSEIKYCLEYILTCILSITLFKGKIWSLITKKNNTNYGVKTLSFKLFKEFHNKL